VNDQNSMRITTGMLNDVLADAQARVQPPTDKGRRLKIYYMTQTGVRPPCFVVFCNSRELFHFSYQRYIENQIRATFGLEGTPIKHGDTPEGGRDMIPVLLSVTALLAYFLGGVGCAGNMLPPLSGRELRSYGRGSEALEAFYRENGPKGAPQ
jgi:hypothetical protein